MTIGPRVPELDGVDAPAASARSTSTGFEIEPLDDVARADALVARRIDELGLPTWPIDPIDAHVAVHEDASGRRRVVFVMNPTRSTICRARVARRHRRARATRSDGERVRARRRGARGDGALRASCA